METEENIKTIKDLRNFLQNSGYIRILDPVKEEGVESILGYWIRKSAILKISSPTFKEVELEFVNKITISSTVDIKENTTFEKIR